MFGSQARPGMRGNLGSLSGSSLGDAPIPPTSEPSTATAAPVVVAKPGMSPNMKIVLGLGAAYLLWKQFKK